MTDTTCPRSPSVGRGGADSAQGGIMSKRYPSEDYDWYAVVMRERTRRLKTSGVQQYALIVGIKGELVHRENVHLVGSIPELFEHYEELKSGLIRDGWKHAGLAPSHVPGELLWKFTKGGKQYLIIPAIIFGKPQFADGDILLTKGFNVLCIPERYRWEGE